jgi:hypothetical protein
MGPYVAHHPDQYRGQQLGVTHQCTDFVKVASGAPPASLWHKGEAVHGNMTIAVGTAIACGWEGNIYPSHPHGNHAAIYMGQRGDDIYVYDQSSSTPVEMRTKIHNTAHPYHVIL